MTMEFDFQILYRQIAVCNADTPQLNNWSEGHIAQGFAWREGSVSFGMRDHLGPSRVIVRMLSTPTDLPPQTQRAISVPFRANADSILIVTVGAEREVRITPDLYELRFSLLPLQPANPEDNGFMIYLDFCPSKSPDFHILKQDTAPGSDMTSSVVLLRNAAPAL